MMFWLITAGIVVEGTVLTVLLAALWAGARADRLAGEATAEMLPVLRRAPAATDRLAQPLSDLPEVA